MTKNKIIGIWGHANHATYDGFGYAGLKLVSSLSNHGFETIWQDETAPVTISFTQPPGYPDKDPSRYDIGYTPWESTEIPTDPPWAEIMNTRDEIWTTSHWCKDVFRDQGVTVPIKVVPHFIDANDWAINQRTEHHPFIFLHMGEPADRKGGQITFDAFHKVFGKNDDVNLVYKTTSWVEARWKDKSGSIIGPVNSYPRVHIMKGTLPIPELNDMFQKCSCLVYPSSGEGFGLIPFQAMATGMPTILPDYSGMSEFARYGINIDFKVGPSDHGYHLGDWCWPDFDSLCAQMAYAYKANKLHRQISFTNGMKLRKEFSESSVMGPVLHKLEEKF